MTGCSDNMRMFLKHQEGTCDPPTIKRATKPFSYSNSNMCFKLILAFALFAGVSAKNWDYTMIEIGIAEKVAYIKHAITVEKVTRGVYALNGSFELLQDLTKGYMVSHFFVSVI